MSMRNSVVSIVGVVLIAVMSGCQTRSQSPPIPPEAMFGTEGAGRLQYVAAEDGTLHVYDMSRNELVFASQVREGQAVVVDPQADRITVDGRRLLEGRLGRGNRHSIHLVPAQEPQTAGGVQVDPATPRRDGSRTSPR